VVRDITAQEVTPDAGKGALGIWRWVRGKHLRTEILVQVVNENSLTSLTANRWCQGSMWAST